MAPKSGAFTPVAFYETIHFTNEKSPKKQTKFDGKISMKSKTKNISCLLLTSVLLCLSGCGGESEAPLTPTSAETPPPVPPPPPQPPSQSGSLSGVFLDAPVQGLPYTRFPSNISETTNENGEFSYEEDEILQFNLTDNVILGSAAGAVQITPYDLETAFDSNRNRALKIGQVLQTLDTDRANAGLIVLDETTLASQFIETINIDAATPEFEASLQQVANSLGVTLVSLGESAETLQANITPRSDCPIQTIAAEFRINDPDCRDRQRLDVYRRIVAPDIVQSRVGYQQLLATNEEAVADRSVQNAIADIAVIGVETVSVIEGLLDFGGNPDSAAQALELIELAGEFANGLAAARSLSLGSNEEAANFRQDVAVLSQAAYSSAACLDLILNGNSAQENQCRNILQTATSAAGDAIRDTELSDEVISFLSTVQPNSPIRNVASTFNELLVLTEQEVGERRAIERAQQIAASMSNLQAQADKVLFLTGLSSETGTITGEIYRTIRALASTAECVASVRQIAARFRTSGALRQQLSQTAEGCANGIVDVAQQFIDTNQLVIGALNARAVSQTVQESLLAQEVIEQILLYGNDSMVLYNFWGVETFITGDRDAIIRAIAERNGLSEDTFGFLDFNFLRGNPEFDLEDVRFLVDLYLNYIDALIVSERFDERIAETELAPRISISDAEADEATGDLIFTVRALDPLTEDIRFTYFSQETGNNSSATAGEDFIAVDTVATILAGETEAQIAVQILDDDDAELSENFQIIIDQEAVLSATSNFQVDNAVAVGTILNDDETTLLVDTEALTSFNNLFYVAATTELGVRVIEINPLDLSQRTVFQTNERVIDARLASSENEMFLATRDAFSGIATAYQTSNGTSWSELDVLVNDRCAPPSCRLQSVLVEDSLAVLLFTANGTGQYQWLDDNSIAAAGGGISGGRAILRDEIVIAATSANPNGGPSRIGLIQVERNGNVIGTDIAEGRGISGSASMNVMRFVNNSLQYLYRRRDRFDSSIEDLFGIEFDQLGFVENCMGLGPNQPISISEVLQEDNNDVFAVVNGRNSDDTMLDVGIFRWQDNNDCHLTRPSSFTLSLQSRIVGNSFAGGNLGVLSMSDQPVLNIVNPVTGANQPVILLDQLVQ